MRFILVTFAIGIAFYFWSASVDRADLEVLPLRSQQIYQEERVGKLHEVEKINNEVVYENRRAEDINVEVRASLDINSIERVRELEREEEVIVAKILGTYSEEDDRSDLTMLSSRETKTNANKVIKKEKSDSQKKIEKKPARVVSKYVPRSFAERKRFTFSDSVQNDPKTSPLKEDGKVKKAKVVFDITPLRTGPGANYPRLTVLTKGEPLVVEYANSDWAKVVTGLGVRAWVSNDSLKIY